MNLIKKQSYLYIIFSLFCLFQPIQSDAANEAYVVNLNGAVGPATADYIVRSLKEANAQDAKLFILTIDTPGGLDQSTRTIIKAIIASDVPVVSYVSPGGARAASAGTYIIYASHIAAMAPGTNLGAATPIQIGGMPKSSENSKDASANKTINDSIAYIRGLAELRNRNVEWSKQAVLNADSLSAEQALKKNVINLIASNIPELLEKINGYNIVLKDKKTTINTKNILIKEIKPDWRSKLLSVITDPSIAYVLLLIAMYGIFFEFANPGFLVPGIAGSICLLLALYAFQLLPINYTGLALIIVGILFMVAEAFVPSFGALGIGGTIAFITGSVLLLDPSVPNMGISWALIIAITITNILFIFFVLGMAIKARQRKIVSGSEQMIGSIGKATSDFETKGQILIHGEIWQAKSETPVKKGQHVLVLKIEGLILQITPYNQKENK